MRNPKLSEFKVQHKMDKATILVKIHYDNYRIIRKAIAALQYYLTKHFIAQLHSHIDSASWYY